MPRLPLTRSEHREPIEAISNYLGISDIDAVAHLAGEYAAPRLEALSALRQGNHILCAKALVPSSEDVEEVRPKGGT